MGSSCPTICICPSPSLTSHFLSFRWSIKNFLMVLSLPSEHFTLSYLYSLHKRYLWKIMQFSNLGREYHRVSPPLFWVPWLHLRFFWLFLYSCFPVIPSSSFGNSLTASSEASRNVLGSTPQALLLEESTPACFLMYSSSSWVPEISLSPKKIPSVHEVWFH